MGNKCLVMVTSILAVLTVVFGVISAVLLALKHHQHDNGEFYTYRRSPAMPCGVVAAVLASLTQILASVAICCCGAWRVTKGGKRIAAVVFFITSWVLAIIAVLLFLAGAMLGFEGSAKKTVGNARIVGGVALFVIATFLFLVVAALDVTSYRLVRKKDHYQAYVGSNPPMVPTTYKDGPNAFAPAPHNQNQV
ncbi:uncharacterized protein LOC123395593 isoform X2 [Hordeum vulgare subsp. vulgare]|uniref:Predicted protein n=2 Tax=Hordeum vulgare subsp. vulgare TaxID=112509 RepID=F2DNS7_HORVV|nr:uncharacterized protein LOC123395593 isoform X2 [Hordeum vulgare subsp. vulgare]XP_044946551.1 uncharacterized protein LOC123395593 isoform X2 [Hordeum vulgare subsp. vulgare]XP_044946552.1 uncharacterized protein LOC123395593 isoform X2 [Hordeum vulgare subsp. vulgare]BAJ96748.1 predicted protein [Hordeum vulgare subsp. vulgare]